jgi:hypothetical protein
MRAFSTGESYDSGARDQWWGRRMPTMHLTGGYKWIGRMHLKRK